MESSSGSGYDVRVGGRGLPITKLISSLKSSSGSFAQFGQTWTGIARDLGMGSERIRQLRTHILLETRSMEDAVYDSVEEWVNREASSATVRKLLNALEQNGMYECGESLRLQFNLPCRPAEKNRNISWKQLSPAFQQKVKENLNGHFPSVHFSNEVLESLEGDLLVLLMTGRKPKLFEMGLPRELSYYISRTVISRNVISSRVFQLKSNDIFVFNGMTRIELSRLAGQKTTGNSSEQLQSISANFLILDTPSHFGKLSKIRDGPVHLLDRDEDGRLRWIKSSGGVSLIHKVIDSEQDYLTEEEFLDKLIINTVANSPVIISDSPGMGKSVLLGQVYRRLSERDPEKIVLYLEMREFARAIKHHGSVCKSAIETALTTEACRNELEKTLLKSKLNQDKITIELLLDGFDEVEVNSADYTFALDILATIRNSHKSVRIWITSRPHLLLQLEPALNTLGYNIQPLSEADQVRFLEKFWLQQGKNLDGDRLNQYAQLCLDALDSSLDYQIAGIPLQCAMIAEVHEEDALDYAKAQPGSTLASTPIISIFQISSTAELYQRLIEKKFHVYKLKYGLNNCKSGKLMERHARFALEHLHPEYSGNLGPTLRQHQLEQMLKVGLLEVTGTSGAELKFIHRTFAEYFLAWLLYDRMGQTESTWWKRLFKEKGWSKLLTNVLFDDVLHTEELDLLGAKFTDEVVCYFLNCLLLKPSSQPRKLFARKKVSIDLDLGTLEAIAEACAYHDYLDIFLFLEANDVFTAVEDDHVFNVNLALAAADYSGLTFFKMALTRAEARREVGYSHKAAMLHRAIERDQFSIIEYLVKEHRILEVPCWLCETDTVLHSSVHNTQGVSDSEIKKKIDIIKFLVENHPGPNLLEERGGTGITPILCQNIDFRLLSELLKMGEDPLATANSSEETVVHTHLRNFLRSRSPQECHQLFSAIPEEKLSKLVHMKDRKYRHTPLARLVHYRDPLPETLDLLKKVGADFNAVDIYGRSVLAIAVKKERGEVTIRRLVENGADEDYPDLPEPVYSQDITPLVSSKSMYRVSRTCVADIFRMFQNDSAESAPKNKSPRNISRPSFQYFLIAVSSSHIPFFKTYFEKFYG